jgi:hypothetical protein
MLLALQARLIFNTGNDVNAFGTSSAYCNTGCNVNAMGTSSAVQQ